MIRRAVLLVSTLGVVLACSGSSREPMPDAGSTGGTGGTGGTLGGGGAGGLPAGGAGAGGRTGCASDADCSGGLKCCYPCGIPGCANQCLTPTSSGACPMFP